MRSNLQGLFCLLAIFLLLFLYQRKSQDWAQSQSAKSTFRESSYRESWMNWGCYCIDPLHLPTWALKCWEDTCTPHWRIPPGRVDIHSQCLFKLFWCSASTFGLRKSPFQKKKKVYAFFFFYIYSFFGERERKKENGVRGRRGEFSLLAEHRALSRAQFHNSEIKTGAGESEAQLTEPPRHYCLKMSLYMQNC